jgi:hypothetical protein
MTTLIQQVNTISSPPFEDNNIVKPTPYERILVPKTPKTKTTKKEKEDAKQEKIAAREVKKQAVIDAKQAKVAAREAKKQAVIDAKQVKVAARQAKIAAKEAARVQRVARQEAARQEADRVAARVAVRQAIRVAREEVLAVRRASRVRESEAWTLLRSAEDGNLPPEYIAGCREAWHVARIAVEALLPRAVAARERQAARQAAAPVEQREATRAAREATRAAGVVENRAMRMMEVMEQSVQNDARAIRRDRNGASKTQDQLIIVEKAFHADNCPICFNDITETNVMTLRCGHQTCGDCLFHHFQTVGGTKCPVCREQYVVRVKGWKPPQVR